MEVAEQRLTMFQRPHKLPIGRARSNMGSDEYNKLAQPALKDCYDHEHKVLEIFEKHAAAEGGGGGGAGPRQADQRRASWFGGARRPKFARV